MSSLPSLQRILVKISWEVIAWSKHVFNYENVDKLAQSLVWLADKWVEVAVVCGAWNIWRWRDTIDAWIDRVKSDHLWMMATVMNAVLLNERAIQHWKKWVVFSPSWVHIPPITKQYNALTARDRLAKKELVFCAWGTWNPFSTTDSGAVLRALELQCDLVLKATKVDGIYSADPLKDTTAVKYDTITYEKALEKNIKVMDQSALWMAKEEEIPIFVCHIDAIWKVIDWFNHWTLVLPAKSQ